MKNSKLRPKKSLGQHFLYDPAIAARIVNAAALEPETPVIELGAGRGVLTKALADKQIRLIALEIDRKLSVELAAFLHGEKFLKTVPTGGGRKKPAADDLEGRGASLVSGGGESPEIINADFTKLSLTGLLVSRGFEKCVLFGNIPYNLTRHVLFAFLVDEIEVIKSAYLMLQKEVGDRIVSGPGSRVYGITSVILQCLYDIRPVARIAAGSFFPPPKIDSAVLEFVAKKEPLVPVTELGAFMRFVKNIFQQRRKILHNSIKTFYTFTEPMLEELQTATGISLSERPEALGKEQLLKLFYKLNEVAKI